MTYKIYTTCFAAFNILVEKWILLLVFGLHLFWVRLVELMVGVCWWLFGLARLVVIGGCLL
jgi:hypothetical protein